MPAEKRAGMAEKTRRRIDLNAAAFYLIRRGV